MRALRHCASDEPGFCTIAHARHKHSKSQINQSSERTRVDAASCVLGRS
jgi:hypothetical protein